MFRSTSGRLVATIMAVAAISTQNVNSVTMQQFTVNIYGNETHDISPILYGIFFEEVRSPNLGRPDAVLQSTPMHTLWELITHCIKFQVVHCLGCCRKIVSSAVLGAERSSVYADQSCRGWRPVP